MFLLTVILDLGLLSHDFLRFTMESTSSRGSNSTVQDRRIPACLTVSLLLVNSFFFINLSVTTFVFQLFEVTSPDGSAVNCVRFMNDKCYVFGTEDGIIYVNDLRNNR